MVHLKMGCVHKKIAILFYYFIQQRKEYNLQHIHSDFSLDSNNIPRKFNSTLVAK